MKSRFLKFISVLLSALLIILVIPGATSSRVKILKAPEVADFIISKTKTKNIYDFDKLRFKTQGAIPTCRSEFRFALCLLSSSDKENNKFGNKVLKKYLNQQVKNPESPYYGSWYYPEYLDKTDGLEWDMFIPITVFQIYFECADNLNEETKELLKRSISTCSTGLKRTWFEDYKSTITHTNYHLLFVCDLLLSSEISGDMIGVSFAKTAFDDFIENSLDNGIYEFNSPTYMAVDLQALYLIEKYSRDSQMKILAGNWADFILLDMIIHYKQDSKWFYGANSRCYSVMAGSGGSVKELERLNLGGITQNMISDVGDIAAVYYEHSIPGWLKNIFKNIPKRFEFESRWSDDLWGFRKTFFTENYVIGSSGRSYGSQDRNVVIDLSRDERHNFQFVPVVSVNDKPWELPRMGGGSGRNHLKIPSFTNQHENKLIHLAHINMNTPVSEQVNRIALTFLCPTNVGIEDAGGKAFVVRNPGTSLFVKPFFLLPKNMNVDFNSAHVREFPGALLDYQLARFDAGIIQVKDVFVGYIIEVFDGEDKRLSLEEWMENLNFEFKKTDKGVFFRFDNLVIDYERASRYPDNSPENPVFDVFKSPFSCVSEGYLKIADQKIPLSFKNLK